MNTKHYHIFLKLYTRKKKTEERTSCIAASNGPSNQHLILIWFHTTLEPFCREKSIYRALEFAKMIQKIQINLSL